MKIIFALLLAVSSYAYAGDQVGKVTKISVRQSDGLHYFYMSGSTRNRPACADGFDYWMIKDENSVAGKSQLSMLLTAYVSGKTVTVIGGGTCTRWHDGEDVNVIYLQ